MEDGDTKLCTNCKRDISTANFVMHEMHCRRHIVLCEHCDEPIPRSELEQHFNDLHAKVPCELCKAEIAKEKMEKHMESNCPKRPVRCEYCELNKPQDSFEAHNDYCGSRTECCPLCQQYIMLKDMTLHESSRCSYPEPKPVAANQNVPNHDPFSMSYLHEFLDSDFRRMDNIPDFTSNLRQELLRDKDRPSRGRKTSNRARTNLPASRGRQSSRNKSNVNAQRERDSREVFTGTEDRDWIPPDMDYDTMLALQLAHEEMSNKDDHPNGQNLDNDDVGLDYHWQHFSEDDDVTEEQTAQEQATQIRSGDMTIPCEFCGFEIPFDLYIEHTAYCQPGETNSIGAINSSGQRDKNNSVPATTVNQRSSIPVIDNLRPSQMSGSAHESTFENSDFTEEIILPCEFCEEMYPSEIILQHQVVCPANGMATPRAATPAAGLRTRRKNREQEVASEIAISSMPDQDDKDEDDLVESDEGPRSNFFRDESYKTSLQSSSSKYGAAGPSNISRFDESSIRRPRRSSRRNSNEVDAEEDGGATRNYEPTRPNRGAQRARARLNQLVNDDGDNGEPAIESIERIAADNIVNNGSRRTVRPSVDKNASGGRNARGSVSSRTVMRELERDSGPSGATATRVRKTNRTSQPATSSQNGMVTTPVRPRPGVNTSTSTNNSSSSSSRNRQRSDQLFSPELRPKPNDNRRL